MKNNKKTVYFGLLLCLLSVLVFFYEKEKNGKLKPMVCKVISYNCYGRGAHINFIYKNTMRSIGGTSRELCDDGNFKDDNIMFTFYYYEQDDTFYLSNNTLYDRYLLFFPIGLFICFSQFISRLVLNFILKYFEK